MSLCNATNPVDQRLSPPGAGGSGSGNHAADEDKMKEQLKLESVVDSLYTFLPSNTGRPQIAANPAYQQQGPAAPLHLSPRQQQLLQKVSPRQQEQTMETPVSPRQQMVMQAQLQPMSQQEGNVQFSSPRQTPMQEQAGQQQLMQPSLQQQQEFQAQLNPQRQAEVQQGSRPCTAGSTLASPQRVCSSRVFQCGARVSA